MFLQLSCVEFDSWSYWKTSCFCIDQLVINCRQLHSDRDPIPEVPAVYFCAPSEENLGRICQDLDNGLYDQYHLNFISPITRQKLEDLAASAIQSNSVINIHKIYDQYLNFICLEDDLFIMKHQQSDSLSYYGKHIYDYAVIQYYYS